MTVNAVSPRALAGDINLKLRQLGADEIAGLERLDPVKLQKLQKGIGEFLDKFGGPNQHGQSDIQQLIGANALESMRELARLTSCQTPSAPSPAPQQARRVGFCGGGGYTPPPPPPAPPPQAPPPTVSPERATPQARPVSPEAQASTPGVGPGDVVLGTLSNGSTGPVRLGGANPAQAQAQAQANARTAASTGSVNVADLAALNLAGVFNPLASNFIPGGALTSNLRSSPTQGFNPLAALNMANGLALNSVAGSFNALANGVVGTPVGSISGVDPNLESLQGAGGGGGMFEDRVFGLMIKIVADMQKQIEERLKKLQEQAEAAEKKGKKGGKGGFLGGVVKSVVGIAAPIAGAVIGGPVGGMIGNAVGKAVTGGGGIGGGGGGAGGAGGSGQESRNIEFEKIKFDMQKLSQMQQALSNILNTMDELAKSAIRQIKGG